MHFFHIQIIIIHWIMHNQSVTSFFALIMHFSAWVGVRIIIAKCQDLFSAVLVRFPWYPKVRTWWSYLLQDAAWTQMGMLILCSKDELGEAARESFSWQCFIFTVLSFRMSHGNGKTELVWEGPSSKYLNGSRGSVETEVEGEISLGVHFQELDNAPNYLCPWPDSSMILLARCGFVTARSQLFSI